MEKCKSQEESSQPVRGARGKGGMMRGGLGTCRRGRFFRYLVQGLLALLMKCKPHDKCFPVLRVLKAQALACLVFKGKLISIIIP